MHGAKSAAFRVLYKDNHLLAVDKAPGVLCQGDCSGDEDLFSMVREWLRASERKPGQAYLASLHRLDRPVSGVVLFATTSKAATRMSLAFKSREVDKRYHALLPPPRQLHADRGIIPARGDDGQLDWRAVRTDARGLLLEVSIRTGRKHQIRRQLASHLSPIVGDVRYGSAMRASRLFLHATSVAFAHPVSREPMHLSSECDF
jgi:23S rRNA pseudouridine1911/1915/1917 synthase